MNNRTEFDVQAEVWIAYLRGKGRKTNTLQTYRNNLNRVKEFLPQGVLENGCQALTPDHIMMLWMDIPVKDEVRHAYLRTLAGLTLFHTGVDVVKKADILHNRETHDRVFIDKSDFSGIYSSADPFQRVIVCLGAFMGLRRGEMASIRDTDIREGVLTIHGKGHGEKGLVTTARMPAAVTRAIDEYRRSDLKEGKALDDYLLQIRNRKGELHQVNVSDVSDAITSLSRSTNIRVTTHSLRRFFATSLYYETECDLQTIRKLMRHADISTTLKCYVDAYDQKEREASEKLSLLLEELVGNGS